jgi:predicted GIY-YIG superfamily endonuclease
MITVYVIKSQAKKYRYIGITSDLERRLKGALQN